MKYNKYIIYYKSGFVKVYTSLTFYKLVKLLETEYTFVIDSCIKDSKCEDIALNVKNIEYISGQHGKFMFLKKKWVEIN